MPIGHILWCYRARSYDKSFLEVCCLLILILGMRNETSACTVIYRNWWNMLRMKTILEQRNNKNRFDNWFFFFDIPTDKKYTHSHVIWTAPRKRHENEAQFGFLFGCSFMLWVFLYDRDWRINHWRRWLTRC